MITPIHRIKKKTETEENEKRKSKKTSCGCFGRIPRKKIKHFHGALSRAVSGHR
jgi:hypothetical protein